MTGLSNVGTGIINIMEEQNFGQGQIINNQVVQKEKINSKKPLGIFSKIFSIILILIQVSIILYTAYLYDKNPGYFAEFGGLPLSYLTLLIVSISFIFGIILLISRKRHLISIILLLINIWLPFSKNIIPLFMPLFGPSVRDAWRDEAVKERNTALDLEKTAYDILLPQLQGTQKILFVDKSILGENLLLLENGDVVQLVNLPYEKQSVFIEWVKNNLINKEVTITPLPLNQWEPNFGVELCSNNSQVPVLELRRRYNVPENKGGFCSVIPVQITFQGKSLSEQFK